MADNLTAAQRSWTMSQIRSVNTRPERELRAALHRVGLRFRKHVSLLPGRPDIVFARQKVAVFIDGDFWHGWRFPAWKSKLSPYWQAKIERNRARDRRCFGRLRRSGWLVIRVWEHSIRADVGDCVCRIERLLKIAARSARNGPAKARRAAAKRHT